MKDPYGYDAHQPGAKLDSGKVDLTLVPGAAVRAIARIMMYGAQKYTRDGWKQVPEAERRYLAACLRHIFAFLDGEEADPESGHHHLHHALCNLAFLAYFLEKRHEQQQQ